MLNRIEDYDNRSTEKHKYWSIKSSASGRNIQTKKCKLSLTSLKNKGERGSPCGTPEVSVGNYYTYWFGEDYYSFLFMFCSVSVT